MPKDIEQKWMEKAFSGMLYIFGVLLFSFFTWITTTILSVDKAIETLSTKMDTLAGDKVRIDGIDGRINGIVGWKKKLQKGVDENNKTISELKVKVAECRTHSN